MIKHWFAIPALAVGIAAPVFACSASSSCSLPHPAVPAAPVASVAVSVTPAAAEPPPGYAPTTYPGLFVRSVPAPAPASVQGAGQILMLPGGTMPELPPASTESAAPPRSFVTPEGITVVESPAWLRSWSIITLGSGGKPELNCLPIREPQAQAALKPVTPPEEGAAK